jgi:hypothetical protein
MPATLLTSIQDGVPVWIVTGIIFVGGYVFDKASSNAERVAVLEKGQQEYREDTREIKEAVQRLQTLVLEAHMEKGHE